MKLSYFGYYIEDTKSPEYHHFNLRPILQEFAGIKDQKYKNSFKSTTDEHTYLFHVKKNIYLYVMTKSHEIIKKIDTEKIDVDEIYTKLDANDKLGFASYVYFSDCYYGLASTIQGPRNRSFVEFVNKILKSIAHGHLEMKTVAFMHQAARADVLSMPIIGKSLLEVGKGNELFNHLCEFIGCGEESIGSFVVEIKPKKRSSSLKKEMMAFNGRIGEEGLERYIIRAKEDQKESLEDFYLASMGGVADSIKSRTDLEIYDEIINKMNNNKTLTEKIEEFRNDERYSKAPIDSLAAFGKSATWSSHISDI